MRFTILLTALAAALTLPPLAAAQADPSVPGPAAPGLSYRSAFDGLPAGVEQGTVGWKDANAAVAAFPRGHADIVRWEAQQAGTAAPAATPPAATPPAAAASQPPAPAPAMPMHHHHGGTR